jgi:hypothetical protein
MFLSGNGTKNAIITRKLGNGVVVDVGVTVLWVFLLLVLVLVLVLVLLMFVKIFVVA